LQGKIGIYLAESIKKGHEKSDDTYWADKDRADIKQHLKPFDVSFRNPAFRMDNLSDSYSVFGRNML
jgi:hypothetical protein